MVRICLFRIYDPVVKSPIDGLGDAHCSKTSFSLFWVIKAPLGIRPVGIPNCEKNPLTHPSILNAKWEAWKVRAVYKYVLRVWSWVKKISGFPTGKYK